MNKKRLDVYAIVLLTITGFIIGTIAGFSAKNDVENALTETTVSQETTEQTTVEETTKIELTTVKFEDITDLTELGTFKLTAYCVCEKCCGKSDGITSSGVKATPYKTVAVDRSVIPLGTELYINGDYFVAQDTGGVVKGNVIDVCVSSHEEAENFGVHYAKVFEVN